MIEINSRDKSPNIEQIVATLLRKELPVIKRMSRNLVGIGQSEFDGLIEKGVSILEATSKELAQQGTEQVQAGRVQRAKAAQDMSQTLRNDISAK